MGGGEEQRAVDAVGDDVLVEQRALLVGVVAARRGAPRRAGPSLAVCRRAKNPATTRPSSTAVTRSNSDRRDRGDRQDGGVAARRAQQRREAGDLDHLHGRGDQDAGQRRERDLGHPARGRPAPPGAARSVGQGGQPGRGSGAHVDGGPRDRGGGGDAAEERGHRGWPGPGRPARGRSRGARRRSSRRPPSPRAGSPAPPARRPRRRAAAGRRARPSCDRRQRRGREPDGM